MSDGAGQDSARRVAVVGCGLVGRAWAICFARAGLDVALFDEKPDSISGALRFFDTALPELEAHGLLGAVDAVSVRTRLRPVTSLEAALEDVRHVQESTFEDVDVKRAVFAKLDAAAAADTVLASSTSALLPSTFTADVPGRHRCLVAHPINPPYLVPAVEVVPSKWTDADVHRQTGELMREIGQAPIMMQREIDGFVMNRMQGALLQEAFRLVAEGYASVEDIDIGIREGLGLRWSFMGPFETIDLNAPGGVADYIARFEGAYTEISQTQTECVPWQGDLCGKIENQRRQQLAADKLGERTLWRDQRLMALRAHQMQQKS